jgi:predicted Zn-dependent peptidase
VDLARARQQVIARLLRDDERIDRAAERAALDLFCTGRVRAVDELVARVQAVDAGAAQAAVTAMQAAGVAVALTGALPRHAADKARAALGLPA